MLTLVALGILAGLPWPAIAIAVAWWVHPGWSLLVVVGYGFRHWWSRRLAVTPTAEAEFYQRLLTELESGVSLRAALAAAVEREPVLDLGRLHRRLSAGSPMATVAEDLPARLPHTGHLARGMLVLGCETGAGMRTAAAGLGAVARQLAEVDRQIRVQTAQARMSALIVGVLPLAVAAGLMATRGGLPESGVGRVLVLVGLALQLVGLAFVAWMLRGSS